MSADGPVLIGYDGSAHARCAIERAGRLLAVRGAIVVTVWESVKPGGRAALLGLPVEVAQEAIRKLDESTEEEARACAAEGARIAQEAGLEAVSRPVQSGGSVWRTLLEVADEEDASAIVLGSRGRSAIASALLGSVSHGVAQSSSRPVLISGADAG